MCLTWKHLSNSRSIDWKPWSHAANVAKWTCRGRSLSAKINKHWVRNTGIIWNPSPPGINYETRSSCVPQQANQSLQLRPLNLSPSQSQLAPFLSNPLCPSATETRRPTIEFSYPKAQSQTFTICFQLGEEVPLLGFFRRNVQAACQIVCVWLFTFAGPSLTGDLRSQTRTSFLFCCHTHKKKKRAR